MKLQAHALARPAHGKVLNSALGNIMNTDNNIAQGMNKPTLSLVQIANMAIGFFGIQMAFSLQGANASRIFQTLGSDVESLAIYWLAGPLTGLVVQPLVGHFSDNAWTRFGRRRPFFVAGAIWAAVALTFMPNAPSLWIAVASLWVLDASINVSMEPFRAFVGDKLPEQQRTIGFAMQTFFIGVGGVLGSWLPQILTWSGVSNEVINGRVPDNVVYAFAIGAAAVIITIAWTVVTTGEYSREEVKAFEAADAAKGKKDDYAGPVDRSVSFYNLWGAVTIVGGLLLIFLIIDRSWEEELYVIGGGFAVLGVLFFIRSILMGLGGKQNFLTHIIDDLVAMPPIMKQLAVVQFFSWVGFFVMWIFTTPAVAENYFGTTDAGSGTYQDAGDWVGIMFGVYSLVSAAYAFVLPVIAGKLGLRLTHAVNLLVGAAGFASYVLFSHPDMLILSMICVGVAWASVLTMPYAILSNGIPPLKMGVYMGIFNFFIVLPQLVVASIMSTILKNLLGGDTILIFLVGAFSLCLAAISLFFVNSTRHKWDPDYVAQD